MGFLGNLFPNVRGGIPRGVGIVPFIVLSFYLLPGYNDLVLIIGILSAVALPMYQKAVVKAKASKAQIYTKQLADAVEIYYLNLRKNMSFNKN